MKHHIWLLPAPLLLTSLLTGVPARAQDDAQATQAAIETVTVTGDRAHLIETQPDDLAFGLPKPLIDTPRAVTVVSDTTLDRYGITGVDTLTAITPSAFTASYYGVEGAVNLRGTLAETYFNGFKRVENRGTYTTPLGDAAQIEILRGPPSAVYGPGKVGGLINFVPKTGAGGDTDAVTGEIDATYGSYSKRNLTGQVSAPFALGAVSGAVHAYGEIDDSYSYYRGLHPSHQLLELAGEGQEGDWSLSADYMYYHSNGEVQTPGWNRLTQALIDNGTYITGSNTALTDADGNGRLSLNELGGNPYTGAGHFQPPYLAYPGCGSCTDAVHKLDSGYGTTWIDRRTVYIAPGVDFSNTVTHTGLVNLSYAPGSDDKFSLQGFVDTLENDRFISYGFPGSYRTLIGEVRARYDFKRDAFDGRLTSQTVAGAGYRYVHAGAKESYNSGVIALDRRDITRSPLATDIIASPFAPVSPGSLPLGWEYDVRSTEGDAGLFLASDIAWDKHLDLTVSGRYDAYDVRSIDLGVLSYEAPSGRAAKGSLTYSASLSYDSDLGLVPYVTNAKSSAIEIGQASEVATSLLTGRDWLSSSALNEAGVKFAFLDQHLVGSLAWYAQTRTQLQQGVGGVTVMGTRAKGGEFELRYVLDRNVSVTFAGSLQHTTTEGPNGVTYIPARTAGVSPQNGFGGAYLVYDFSQIRPGTYEDTLIPHAVLSPYVTFTSDPQSWGEWGTSFGGTYVSRTAQTVPDPLVFPASVTLNASAFLRHGLWEMTFNVDNLANARAFTPDADTYSNLGALPLPGRQWRITLKRVF